MTTTGDDRLAKRLRIVDEHIRQENLHDLAAIMDTFGETARYDDEPWNERFEGHDGVRAYYESLLAAAPDLHLDVKKRYSADEVIVLEIVMSGTHTGPWRGLPATGRRLELPVCAIFRFDAHDKLAGERIYYDRATVLKQLGLLHEPEGLLSRLLTPLMHPLTILRMARHKLLAR